MRVAIRRDVANGDAGTMNKVGTEDRVNSGDLISGLKKKTATKAERLAKIMEGRCVVLSLFCCA